MPRRLQKAVMSLSRDFGAVPREHLQVDVDVSRGRPLPGLLTLEAEQQPAPSGGGRQLLGQRGVPRLRLLAERALAHGRKDAGGQHHGGDVCRVELGNDFHEQHARQAEEVACRSLEETRRCHPLARVHLNLAAHHLCFYVACSSLDQLVREDQV
eukprot:scaffold17724_cov51-Phaeocystis_antarctica.AAC.3